MIYLVFWFYPFNRLGHLPFPYTKFHPSREIINGYIKSTFLALNLQRFEAFRRVDISDSTSVKSGNWINAFSFRRNDSSIIWRILCNIWSKEFFTVDEKLNFYYATNLCERFTCSETTLISINVLLFAFDRKTFRKRSEFDWFFLMKFIARRKSFMRAHCFCD